jgi:hypothetical protein
MSRSAGKVALFGDAIAISIVTTKGSEIGPPEIVPFSAI